MAMKKITGTMKYGFATYSILITLREVFILVMRLQILKTLFIKDMVTLDIYNFEDTLYKRHGDPRHLGLSVQYDF